VGAIICLPLRARLRGRRGGERRELLKIDTTVAE